MNSFGEAMYLVFRGTHQHAEHLLDLMFLPPEEVGRLMDNYGSSTKEFRALVLASRCTVAF